MRELALFAGAGGGILGSQLLGWHTVCAVELDPYCREVLLTRQREGHLKPFPIWDDIRTFDAAAWRGHVDVITGGFPCQGISAAGKGLGLSDPRSGLVFEMLSIINEIRPRFVLAENSPNLRTKGLGPILSALAGMGYDAKWGVLGAWHAGAPHRRNRLWIVATDANRAGMAESPEPMVRQRPSGDIQRKRRGPYTESNGRGARGQPYGIGEETQRPVCGWPPEPDVGRVAYGVADRVDRIRAIGNGQVPRVVELAWRVLSD